MEKFSIENVVCNYSLGFRVDLAAFQQSEGTLCEYDPALFPAAMYSRFPASTHNRHKKFAALISCAGRIIITGSRDPQESLGLFELLHNKLMFFRAGHSKRARAAIEHDAAGALVPAASTVQRYAGDALHHADDMDPAHREHRERVQSYHAMNEAFHDLRDDPASPSVVDNLLAAFSRFDLERIAQVAPEFRIQDILQSAADSVPGIE
jgi:hypothetical protein